MHFKFHFAGQWETKIGGYFNNKTKYNKLSLMDCLLNDTFSLSLSLSLGVSFYIPQKPFIYVTVAAKIVDSLQHSRNVDIEYWLKVV